MTSPRHTESDDFAFAEGHQRGLSWVLRAATADQVKELLVGSLDPAHLAAWGTAGNWGTHEDEAGRFRAGFHRAAGEVIAHLRRFRAGTEPWAYADLQPDAVGVVLRLRTVLEGSAPPASQAPNETAVAHAAARN